MQGRERDVLVGADVTRDNGIVGCPGERTHEVHGGRRCGVAARGDERQIAIRREHQACAVVAQVVVDRADAEPLEARRRDAVDTRAVDEAAERVDVLTCRRGPRPGGRRRACERHLREVIRERLEWIVRVEGEWHACAGRFVAKTEVVVHELAPDPGPLGQRVLGEDVLADVVEHAVAHVPRRWTADDGADAVGVIGRPDTLVERVRASPIGVERIVPAAVERADDERGRGCGGRIDREDDDREEQCEGGTESPLTHDNLPPLPPAVATAGRNVARRSPFTRATADLLGLVALTAAPRWPVTWTNRLVPGG